ncbi:DinB family protein [Fulvivirga lutimaris]|uniref:DinB family protein n=1 Tax=Fulvivirga lutimaris TaxID=1819566 RepID=UPI0012BB6F2A|nr:DinB family protein [Fulvivirga lutimaris]MTI39221.1 DinB family protein [Fulvivirga lutimaris]
MAKISQQEFLSSLEDEISRQLEFAKNLEDYSEETLNQKVDAKSWSVLECLEHMNLSMLIYLDQFKMINNFKPSGGLVNFGIKGKFFAEGMRPKNDKIAYKMKTFKKLTPASHLGKQVIENFLSYSTWLSGFIKSHKSHDLNRIRVKTALGPLVKLNVAEALSFVIAHNERHIWQANNVLKAVE